MNRTIFGISGERPEMKRRLIAVLCGASALAIAQWGPAAAQPAGPGSHPGAAFVLGPVSHPHNPGGVYNPAAAAEPNRDDHIGIGEGGFGMELGEVDSLIDDLDELNTFLDDPKGFLEDNPDVIDSTDPVGSVEDYFNGFLEQAGQDGYVKGSGYAAFPLTPARFRLPEREDALTLEYNLGMQARLGVSDAPVEITDNSSTDPADWDVTTDTAIHVQDAQTRELNLGYARPLFRHGGATLLSGVKVRLIQGELYHAIVPLEGTDEDTMDLATDLIGDDPRTTSKMGVDVGTLWVTPTWRAGATIVNLNQPTLDYPEIGVDCDEKEGDARVRCDAAAGLANDMDLEPTYTLTRQLRLEGVAHTEDGMWAVAGYLEANAAEDAFGEEYQWAGVSVSSAPASGWYPGYRMGYRTNLAGTGLSYVTTGLSFFSTVHVDIGYALDEVEFDNEVFPRSLTFNLRAGISF